MSKKKTGKKKATKKRSPKTEHQKQSQRVARLEATSREIVSPDDIPREIHEAIDGLTGISGYLETKRITNWQLQKMIRSASSLGGGVHKSAAIICSDRCILTSRCLLAISSMNVDGQIDWDEMPVGLDCPQESQVANKYEDSYVVAYAEKSEQEAEDVQRDPFVMQLISELVEGHLLEQRLNTKLAEEGGGLMMDEAVGINNEGEVATHMKESPLFKMKTYLKKRRSEILKLLLLSPEARLKGKVLKRLADPSTAQSAITERAKSFLQGKLIEDAEIVDPTALPPI